MRRGKKIIIIISVILILAILGISLAYLYLTTDMFKSNDELFAKYFMQNAENLKKILNSESVQNTNKFEVNTNIKVNYSEGGEISNPLNNLALKLDIQKDDDEQYFYADAKILYEDQKYLEAELIQQQEKYGIRFTDAVLQFITVEKEDNPYFNEQIISDEQLDIFKNKYLNIIKTAFSNGVFEKQTDEAKINTYSVFLNSEQVKNMLIEILNNLKTENEILDNLPQEVSKQDIIKQIDEFVEDINESTEIPTIKMKIYEQNKKIIKTDLEIGTYIISAENDEQNGKIKIVVTPVNVEEDFSITILTQMKTSGNKKEIDVEISYKQDITTISLLINNDINIGENMEKKESLVSDNNVPYSAIGEKRMQKLLEEVIIPKFNENIGLLIEKFIPKVEVEPEINSELEVDTEIENQFQITE